MALPRETTLSDRLYNAREFMALSLDPGKRYELVRGVIQEMSQPNEEHTLISSNLTRALLRWLFTNPRGEVGRVLPPGGFELKIPNVTRDTVRGPDLSFVAKGRLTGQPGTIKAVPDLAVEIYSPNDRPGIINEKLEDYRLAGWDAVWVVYPSTAPIKKRQTVELYHLQASAKPVKVLAVNEQLEGEGILAGFSMPLAELFNYGN